jgi:hypothetical protein
VRSGFGVHTINHFMLPKLRLVFSQRTCPIHFFRPKTKFQGGFTRFRCREVPVVRSGLAVHRIHHFLLPKLRLVFSQRTCPIHFFRPKTKFLWLFHVIPLPGGTRCEIRFWGAYNAPLCASEVASSFSQRTCAIHFFRPKTKFLGGFARFRCREVPVVRSGFGVLKCTTL